MANTPVYGWETPDDTDYVYQGAAAARTTANAIDSTLSTNIATINATFASTNTTIAALPQGVKSYVRDASANLTLTTTETAMFTSPSFTPLAGRLYEITYTVGDIYKTTAQGDVYVALRANNTAGFLIDRGYMAGLNRITTAGYQGGSFTRTMVATSSILGTSAFVPCVTIQPTVSGAVVQNINQAGAISIKDIGPA
jgi:hypothetical protein